MSSSASHRPQRPEPPPPGDEADPVFDKLGDGQADFLDAHAPSTDNTPTIISKNGIVQTEGLRPETISMSDLRGRRLAHFELLESIGVGGMAAVLRARDMQLDRTVALKILPPDMAVEEENVRRFHQEARAAAKLDHENIARVFYCGEDQHLHFIAFEYVEGENLRNLAEKRGRLPVKETIHYMLQIAAGLAHASERGVVHRDIKPSNIIITPDGRAKLVDMGLARSLDPHAKDALTQSGVTLGTFDYISPEQALEPRDADVRSDIYSLGCTFYHVLTGQPPVPEGTAAKKLHHHQHVLPVDPRQLNPNIPDNVAAILCRTMAKDPKGRYQRPEHLVQHLLQAAQELGMPTDMPTGMMYINAPLPNPPQKRPGLVIGLALAGLAAALVLLSFAPSEPDRNQSVSVNLANALKDKSDAPALVQGQEKTLVPPKNGPEKPVTTVAQLLQEVQRPDLAKINVAGKLELGSGGKVILRDRNALVVQGAPAAAPDEMCKIRLSVNGDAKSGPAGSVRGGVTVEGGSVTFRNILFELDAKVTPDAMRFALVLVKNGAEVTFDRCVFAQTPHWEEMPEKKDKSRPVHPLSSVFAMKNGADSAKIHFQQCFFAHGQAAVTLDGPAVVDAANCAFGPHRALFHLFGASEPVASKLALTNCTALVAGGPVLRLDNQSGATLTFKKSLFTRPQQVAPLTSSDRLNLIQQMDASESLVQFTGFEDNCYHNLNAYWIRAAEKSIHLLKDFKLEMTANGMEGEDDSIWLAAEKNPLAATDPVATLLQNGLGQAWSAFKLNPKAPSPQLPNWKEIGVQSFVWGESYPYGYFPKADAPTDLAKEIIVDPNLPEESAAVGHFRTLHAAIAEAKKDEAIILIQHNGPLPVQAVPVNKPGKTITIQPKPGYHPLLTLDSDDAPAEAALFQVQRGQIIFKDLAFQLEPDRKDFTAQSVVLLSGQGQCKFKNCVVTLRPSTKFKENVALNVVSFAGTGSGGDLKIPGPKVELHDSLVRGEGVFLNFSKPGHYDLLEVKNSVVLLAGTLVQAHINCPVKLVMPGMSKIKLDRSIFYVQNHLLELTDEDNGQGLITTTCSAGNCLFAADTSPMPLILFDGPGKQDKINQLVPWLSGGHNAYCGFDTIMSQRAPSGSSPLDIKANVWQMMKEPIENDDAQKTVFLDNTFDLKLMGDRPLADAHLEDVQSLLNDLNKKTNGKKGGVSLLTFGPNLGKLREDLPLMKAAMAPATPQTPEQLSASEP